MSVNARHGSMLNFPGQYVATVRDNALNALNVRLSANRTELQTKRRWH